MSQKEVVSLTACPTKPGVAGDLADWAAIDNGRQSTGQRTILAPPVTQGTAPFGALGHHAPKRTVGCDE
jgi:hypothetical protein